MQILANIQTRRSRLSQSFLTLQQTLDSQPSSLVTIRLLEQPSQNKQLEM